jgi:hypothetical protein
MNDFIHANLQPAKEIYQVGETVTVDLIYTLSGAPNPQPAVVFIDSSWNENIFVFTPIPSQPSNFQIVAQVPREGTFVFYTVVQFQSGEWVEKRSTFTVQAQNSPPPPAPVPVSVCTPPPALSDSTFLEMDFSRNPVTLFIPSVASLEPAKLRYKTDIFVPANFSAQALPDAPPSANFVTEFRLETVAPPPQVNAAGQQFFNGGTLYLQEVLHAYLKTELPGFDQQTIQINRKGQMPYYNRFFVDPVTANHVKTSETRWAFMGGLPYEDFPGHQFFTGFLHEHRLFLTWQPAEKTVETDQREYLYFLLNMEPLPTLVRLKGNITFTDGNCEQHSLLEISGMNAFDVLCIPAGHNQLKLDLLAGGREVATYRLWLENGTGERLSQVRTYHIERKYRRHKRFILFQNSLGRFDTLRCYGAGKSQLSADRNLVGKFTPVDYKRSDGQEFVSAVSGEDVLEVSTGYFTSVEQMAYLQELLLSEKVYLIGPNDFIPVEVQTKSILYQVDDEYLYYTTIKLRKLYNKNRYARYTQPGVFYAREGWTAICPQGQTGAPVTRWATAFSTQNMADAKAQALAKAKAAAEAALVCSVFVPQTVSATVLVEMVQNWSNRVSYRLRIVVDEPVTRDTTINMRYTGLNGFINNYPALIPEGASEKVYEDVTEYKQSGQAYTVTHQVLPGDDYQVGSPSEVTIEVQSL